MSTETPKEMTSLADIEKATRQFADSRNSLAGLVRELNDTLNAAKARFLPAIRRAVAKTAERRSELSALVEGVPTLFVKPRTVVFHGVKVGLEKGKGSIEFDEPEQVVARIKKLYGEDTVLIRVKEEPNKKAIEELPAGDLKRIGCRIVECGDLVVIKPVDGEVDKVVNALLKESEEPVQVKEAA